jgi:hypothetical protein
MRVGVRLGQQHPVSWSGWCLDGSGHGWDALLWDDEFALAGPGRIGPSIQEPGCGSVSASFAACDDELHSNERSCCRSPLDLCGACDDTVFGRCLSLRRQFESTSASLLGRSPGCKSPRLVPSIASSHRQKHAHYNGAAPRDVYVQH